MFEDPHVVANNLVVELDHPVVGKIKMANSPLKMSDAETGATTSSPALGQHTREFLAEIGFAPEQVQGFLSAGVVRAWAEGN
jgi:crotonobetainyl-CoA:carnitine CoA-transferase CaiB-like acyl-CoA transferase